MGKCIYCGKDAGLFRKAHSDCEERYNSGMADIRDIVSGCFRQKDDFYLYKNRIEQIKNNANIDNDACDELYCESLEQAVEEYLDNGLIEPEEENTVARFMQFTGLSQQRLNRNMALEKVVQSKVLQELFNGLVPAPRITINGSFPFILSKNEKLIWLFRDVTLQMQKTRRETVGRTRGMSFRICRGVYYRTGGFRGHPVETEYTASLGTGSVCLTDKNLYFHSPEKSLKIPFSKIISLDTYSNGLGVHRAGANEKPLFFLNLNSWFCYNVIAHLTNSF